MDAATSNTAASHNQNTNNPSFAWSVPGEYYGSGGANSVGDHHHGAAAGESVSVSRGERERERELPAKGKIGLNSIGDEACDGVGTDLLVRPFRSRPAALMFRFVLSHRSVHSPCLLNCLHSNCTHPLNDWTDLPLFRIGRTPRRSCGTRLVSTTVTPHRVAVATTSGPAHGRRPGTAAIPLWDAVPVPSRRPPRTMPSFPPAGSCLLQEAWRTNTI